jgi:dihydroorotase
VLGPDIIQSKSKNTPFLNKELKGITVLAVIGEKIWELNWAV